MLNAKKLVHADLNILPKLLVLLKTRSVSKSAEYFGMSQPAMSRVLERLRKAFSDPLLIRSGNTMIPTPKARQLMPILEDIMAQAGKMLAVDSSQPFDPTVQARHFVIACDDYTQVVLADIMTPLVSQPRSKATFQFLPMPDKYNIEYMAQNSVDILVCPPLRTDPQLLRTHTLYQDEYVCLRRVKNAAERLRKLSLKDHCGMSHLQVANFRNDFQQFCLDEATLTFLEQRSIRYTVHCFSQVAHIVATTDMLCALPRNVAQRIKLPSNVAALELDFPAPQIEQLMHWHNVKHHDSAARWLRQTVIDQVNKEINGETKAVLFAA